MYSYINFCLLASDMADKGKQAINNMIRNSKGAGIGAGLIAAAAAGGYAVMQSIFTGMY